ncbi:putative phytosulfokines 6 [Herrania umbratica]|uniref:Phytosulfokine n=1 Tax=Herrania umbratica TaxID=108875 RepID=A0A6J1AQT4_9ROSI|nr:putative phytosulfokines 6 [Herrania umbratica]
MKEKFLGLITFLLFAFLLCSYSTSARLLAQKQGEKELKANQINQAGLLATDVKEDFSNLMGSEECYEKDEECLKRRMIAEAHLDYIYTQHHKP